MKNLLVVVTLAHAFLIGCSQSGGGSSTDSSPAPRVVAPLQGTDFTGTYKASEIQCFDVNTSALTAVSSLTGGTSVLTVHGNSATETDTGPSCTIEIKQSVVFNDARAQFTVSQRTATTSNSASCTATFNLTSTFGPNLSQASVSFSVDHNTSLTDQTVGYFGTPSTGIWIGNGLKPQGRSTDLCFMKFNKQ